MPDLPIIGNVPKGWLIFVGAGSAGAIGYFVWKRHQAAAATTTSTAPTGTAAAAPGGDPYPPDGTYGNPSDPYSTDPETGMTYGDEQLYGGGYGYGGGGYPGTGIPPPSGGGTPGPGSFTTNAEWASYAEQQLQGIVDPTALSAAVGVYLTGRPATSDQVGLIDQAIAIGGYPPVAGPANQPPGINESAGGGGGGQVAVPNVVGQNWEGAIKQISAAGLKPSPSSKPHGARDPITSESPAAGTQVASGSTVTIKGR